MMEASKEVVQQRVTSGAVCSRCGRQQVPYLHVLRSAAAAMRERKAVYLGGWLWLLARKVGNGLGRLAGAGGWLEAK